MSTENIKKKTKDYAVRTTSEDYEKLGKDKKAGFHKLVVNEPLLTAQIKELKENYAQSEAKVAQLSLQIENSKLGFQLKAEDETFNYDIVQEFCKCAVWNPFEKPPRYMCTNPVVSNIIHLQPGNKITTAICRKCVANRQSFLDATSETSMIMKALKIAGRKNVPLIVALHNQLQGVTHERDQYKEFTETHRERTAEAYAQAAQTKQLLENKLNEQGRDHRTKEYEQRAQIKKDELEKNDLKNQNSMLESRLSEIKNHDAEFETLRLENAKLKERIETKDELNYMKTCLEEIQEQTTQAQLRLSKNTDAEAIIQSVQRYPDWAARFQTIGTNDELRGKLETAENTVASLKIQQESNNQTINTLKAGYEALSTVEKTFEYDLTSLKKEMSGAQEIIIDLNKYFTNKQNWESRKHVDMPENYDELTEAIMLKTEMRRKAALFIQKMQG